jgi:hypothetical protein
MTSATQDERDSAPAAEPMTLCIKGEYRRSSLYLLLGLTAAGLVAFALQGEKPGDAAVQGIVICLLVAGAFWLWLHVQTWRLRIDSTGLARRRLGMWSCWKWRHFSDGHVRVGDSPLSFSNSARPWWDRWLNLEYVEPEAAAKKLANLLRTLTPSLPEESNPAEAVPGEITLGLGCCSRLGQVQFTARGIELRRGRQLRWIEWDDVAILRLVREQVNRAIATRLELRPRGDDPVIGSVCSVRIDGQRILAIGARKADWPWRLEGLAPSRCWEVFRTVGDLQSRAEGEFRLAYYRKKLAVTRRLRAVLPPLLLALGGAVFIPQLIAGWNAQFFPASWKAVALGCTALMMVQPAFMVWAILHFTGQHLVRKLRETETELSRFHA